LRCWWAGLHAFLLAAVATCRPEPWIWLVAVPAVAAHFRLGFPASTGLILYLEPGGWSLPLRGEHGLRLGPGSGVWPFAVVLAFEGTGRRQRLLLLSDQLDRESWRRLQIACRSGLSGRS
jgi:hypothetical protein